VGNVGTYFFFYISSSSAVESYKLYKDRVTNNFNVFLAESWIDDNLKTDINVLVDVYAPPLFKPKFNVYQRDCELGLSKIEKSNTSRVTSSQKVFDCMEGDLESFVISMRESDIRVVILSDLHLRLEKDIESGGTHAKAAEEYYWLFENFNVFKAFEEGNGRPVYLLRKS
jgi:hypothetical protein